MSRNKIQCNTILFNKIKATALSKFQIPSDNKIRWIKFDKDDDKNISNVSLRQEKYFYSNNVHVHKYISKTEDLDYETYFLFGIDTSRLNTTDLEEMEPSASLSLIILSEEDIIPTRSKSSSDYRELMQDLYRGNQFGYLGHDYQQITCMFPKFSIVKSNALTLDIDQVTLLCLLTDQDNYNLDYSKEFISMCESVVYLDNFPVFNIIDAILSPRWEMVYISLYRCLEHYYNYSYFLKLRLQLGFSVGLEEFSSIIEETMDWRPKEEISLKNLMSSIDDQVLVDQLKTLMSKWKEVRGYAECHSMIYKTRNSIVHSRHIFSRPEYSQEDWGKICEYMLDIIIKCHGKIKAQLDVQNHINPPVIEATA